MCDKKVSELLKLVTKDENFIDYKIQVLGKTERGDRYLGKVTFASVTGKTKNEDTKGLNLVIKTSAENELLRNELPIKRLFELEIYIYEKSLPTCYLTRNFENNEALILENLKARGFEMANRKIPLTFLQVRLVLEGYGKWHAFSLALRYKQPETFKRLVKNYGNMWSTYISQVKMAHIFFQYYEEVRTFWEDDKDVASIKFSESEVTSILMSLVFEDLDHAVILHGDSWTNNFMFKVKISESVLEKQYYRFF